jgi:hypothetical protein
MVRYRTTLSKALGIKPSAPSKGEPAGLGLIVMVRYRTTLSKVPAV